jgi:hypothetical protein
MVMASAGSCVPILTPRSYPNGHPLGNDEIGEEEPSWCLKHPEAETAFSIHHLCAPISLVY